MRLGAEDICARFSPHPVFTSAHEDHEVVKVCHAEPAPLSEDWRSQFSLGGLTLLKTLFYFDAITYQLHI